MKASLQRFAFLLVLCASISVQLQGQSLDEYSEFYRSMRRGPLDEYIFCGPTDSAATDPMAIGVRRDSLGRPLEVARFRFGNIDNTGDYSVIRVEYVDQESSIKEMRTFHLSNGAPTVVGKTTTEEVLRRRSTGVMIRSLLNRKGEPVDDSVWVSRAFFTGKSDGTYEEQWFVSTGKQQKGAGSDLPGSPFGSMPPSTYFRRFGLDGAGNLAWERVFSFEKRPIPYPGGEVVRRYRRDSCSRAVVTTFEDADGKPMVDSGGVHEVRERYDVAGNLLERSFHALDGSLRFDRHAGYARIELHYRRFDNVLVNTELFDAQNRPVSPPGARN